MNILKTRYINLWISVVLFILSVFLLLGPKLNLGIDMTWWIQTEYSYNNSIDLEKLNNDLKNKKVSVLYDWKQIINNINVYPITWEKTLAVVVWFHLVDDEKKLEELKTSFRNQVLESVKSQDSTAIESRFISIWKSFWDYIKKTAFLTLFISIIAIAIYITFAFSWIAWWISIVSFAIITIITLFHDVIVASWMYIFTWMFFPEYQIDTFFVTALLTILGYSINDTIVIFDRIRSNLIKYAWKTWKQGKELYEIINLSVNETMTRSIYTSLTVVIVLVTIFIFWPESISGFILAMIYWTIVGTYSSIFIASPILYEVNKNKKLSVYKKEVARPEDKIVV